MIATASSFLDGDYGPVSQAINGVVENDYVDRYWDLETIGIKEPVDENAEINTELAMDTSMATIEDEGRADGI